MLENISTIEILENEDDNIDVAEEVSSNAATNSECTDNNLLQEDLLQIRLRKMNSQGMPTYSTTTEKGSVSSKSHKSSQFVQYQGAFIRKSTAQFYLAIV